MESSWNFGIAFWNFGIALFRLVHTKFQNSKKFCLKNKQLEKLERAKLLICKDFLPKNSKIPIFQRKNVKRGFEQFLRSRGQKRECTKKQQKKMFSNPTLLLKNWNLEQLLLLLFYHIDFIHFFPFFLVPEIIPVPTPFLHFCHSPFVS